MNMVVILKVIKEGDFESAWLADLEAAYIFSETETLFEQTIYHGIYGRGGFIVFGQPKKKKQKSTHGYVYSRRK